jgi:cytochrome P450
MGYRFEAGTVFVSNNFHINANNAEYPEATRFNPERFPPYEAVANVRFMNQHVMDVLQGHIGWGSGRRICAGWNVGWKNMFITFSRLLYCFDFYEDPVLAL